MSEKLLIQNEALFVDYHLWRFQSIWSFDISLILFNIPGEECLALHQKYTFLRLLYGGLHICFGSRTYFMSHL